jgi:hypothetical protein
MMKRLLPKIVRKTFIHFRVKDFPKNTFAGILFVPVGGKIKLRLNGREYPQGGIHLPCWIFPRVPKGPKAAAPLGTFLSSGGRLSTPS